MSGAGVSSAPAEYLPPAVTPGRLYVATLEAAPSAPAERARLLARTLDYCRSKPWEEHRTRGYCAPCGAYRDYRFTQRSPNALTLAVMTTGHELSLAGILAVHPGELQPLYTPDSLSVLVASPAPIAAVVRELAALPGLLVLEDRVLGVPKA